MKLYYAPGACSLAPHMALREAGLEFELEQVDLTNRKTASGEDFTRINPLGYVPCLRRDDGETLTECAVLLQWIADQSPELGLAPPEGIPLQIKLTQNAEEAVTAALRMIPISKVRGDTSARNIV